MNLNVDLSLHLSINPESLSACCNYNLTTFHTIVAQKLQTILRLKSHFMHFQN